MRLSARRDESEHTLSRQSSITTGRDPYQRRVWAPEPIARIAAALALVTGMAYLGWRIADTSTGVPLWLWLPLVVAEVLGFVHFGFFVHRSWHTPRPSKAAPGSRRTVDVMVTTYNDPIDNIRATLIGCGGLTQAHTTWVLDDGNRSEVAALAAEHGAEYIGRPTTENARSGNVNHAMAQTDGELVLLLAPGDIPMPDLLDRSLGHFDHDDVAAVVIGTSEADGVSDHLGQRNQPDALELEVVAPSLDAVNAVPWNGGPALVRRTALTQVGGMAVGTLSTEYQTGLRLQAHGWQVRFHNQALAETLPVRNLQARLALRDRQARGVMQALRSSNSPLRASGLTATQRIAYLADSFAVMMSVQRLILISVAIAVMTTAELPFRGSVSSMVSLWVPWFVLGGATRWLLGRGRIEPAGLLRRDLRNMAVDVSALSALFARGPQRYRFAPKATVDTGGLRGLSQLRLLSSLFVVLDLALLYRVADVGFADAPAVEGRPFLAMLAASLWMLVSMLWTLHTAVTPRQRRLNYRRPVAIAATLRGAMIRVLDLVVDGIGFETGMPLRKGERATVRVNLPDATGAIHEVALAGTVIWAIQVGPGGTWRAGVQFDELRPIDRDRVVEFCSVTLPYSQLRNGGLRQAPLEPAA